MRLAIAAVIVLATSAQAAAQVAIDSPVARLGPDTTLLSLTAEGQSRRTPDIAMFSAGVVTEGKTAGEAMKANASRMDAVVAALKREGVADRDIQTSALSLQPRYSDPARDEAMRARMARQPYTPPAEPQVPKIIGYEARNTVQVRVRRLASMGGIIDTLVGAGANQVDGPSFTLDEPKAALDEARTEAMQQARQRAELYARAAGLRVARILSISESPGYYPVQGFVASARFAGAPPPPPPPTPVAPGELTMGVNLSVQFALER